MSKMRRKFLTNQSFTSFNTVITIKDVRAMMKNRSLICERITEWKLNK